MARRRRGDGDPAEAAAEAPAGDGQPQIEVRMRGGADDVKKQLGVATAEAKPEKPVEPNHDEEKKKFVDSLRNPKFIIRVKRVTPREFNGVKTNVEVWSSELPLSYQEIQEEVAKAYMGGKYRVAVVDPASNSTIAADTFEVGGDPNIPEPEASQEELDRILMRGAPKDAAALTEEGLERRARVSAKMLEVEALESQLEEARERRKRPDAGVGVRDTRVDELERRLIEAKHQAELEARDRKHAEEMRELKALIAQSAAPAKPQSDMTMVMLEQMREDRKAAQAQFTALLTQMKDDKLNAVLEEVKAIKNKPQQNNMLEMAETMLKLNKMISGVAGDDDDDDDDADDDRPWWEKALDKLGGKFGDKLLAKFTDMEEKGQTVDREAFIKEMSGYADQVAAEAVSRQQQALPAPAKPHALPPPPAQLPPPPSVPAAQNPVTQLPPPPPPAAPQALPPAPPQQNLTIEQEIMLRVAGTLEMLSREMVLRPNEYHWNYEGCWTSLPEDILEKVCAAPDAVGIIDALTIPGVDPAKAAELKEKIAGNHRMAAWINVGLGELKEWWAEKQKDPKFDPFADDDGAEEEGGEE